MPLAFFFVWLTKENDRELPETSLKRTPFLLFYHTRLRKRENEREEKKKKKEKRKKKRKKEKGEKKKKRDIA